MKTTVVVLALVLVALVAPSPSAAVYPFCPDCLNFGMGASSPCTCPGTAPHWRFSTCGTYPAGCILEDAKQPDLDTFLSSLAPTPAVPADASYRTPDLRVQ